MPRPSNKNHKGVALVEDRPPRVLNAPRRRRSASRHHHQIRSIKCDRCTAQASKIPGHHSNTVPSPIARLPAELLRAVFLYYRQEWEYSLDVGGVDRYPLWTTISHVCRRWRSVVQEFKFLWTKLPVGGIEWTEMALASSYPLPLDIRIVFTKSASQAGGTLKALEGTSRARKISLVDAWDEEHESLLSEALAVMSNYLAPTLETLDISAYFGDDRTTIPDELFLGHAPMNLRTLVLHSIGFSVSLPLLSAPLTTLHLGSCRTNMSVEDMLIILAHLPSLEDISLEDTDFSDLNGDPLEERTCTELSFPPHSIFLPNLRCLSFFDTVYMITTIMLYLAIPPDTYLEIDCDCQSTTIEEATAAMAVALQDHFSPILSAGLAFRELSISCQSNPAENITFELAAPAATLPPEPSKQLPFPGSLCVSWALRPGDIAVSLGTLGGLLPGTRYITSVRAAHDVLLEYSTLCDLALTMGLTSVKWI